MTQILKENPVIARQELVKLVRKWGEVNSDGILDPNCQIYSSSNFEGVIGYRIENGHAIVFGDPVCDPENKALLALEFQTFCEEQGIGVVYSMVSEEFSHWGTEQLASVMIEFGEKFILNPAKNPVDNTGSKAVLVRKKVKHARKAGLNVDEYLEKDPSLQQQMEDVAKTWLKNRRGLQVYLCEFNLFENCLGKRWFYAHANNRIVGILILNELKSHGGWLMNNLMEVKDAPSGTSELLVISTLQVLAKENCHFVLIGPVPAANLGKIVGLNSFSSTIIQFLYKSAQMIFHLHGHEVFWSKFQPIIQKTFLLFPKKNLNFSSLKGLIYAFNAGK